MFKKVISIILALSFLVSTAGCSGALRKKFVRQKKSEKKNIPVFKPKDYEAEFTLTQRYLNHYIFWKNAHRETINILRKTDINNKKLKFHASYAVIELGQMRNLLPTEKQEEIDPYISELTKLEDKMGDSTYVSSHKNTLRTKWNQIYNAVFENFSYNKIKKFLQN